MVGNGVSDWFPVDKGKDVSSNPIFWHIYGILCEVYEDPKVICHAMRDVRYADDTALLSKTANRVWKIHLQR